MASHARSYRAGLGKGAAAPVASPAGVAPSGLCLGGLCAERVGGGGAGCVRGFCYFIAHKVTEAGDSHFSGGFEHLHFNVQACGNSHVHQGVEAE